MIRLEPVTVIALFALSLLQKISVNALISPLCIGTRPSPLAQAQARAFAERLLSTDEISAQLVLVDAAGDVATSNANKRAVPLAVTRVDFTGSLDEALLRGDIDVAVHSLKDVSPTWTRDHNDELMIGCHLPRQDATDALVSSKNYPTIKDLPKNARIGTSSVRRQSQLLSLRPDLNLVNVRGNVQARLDLLLEENGDLDAVIVASSGLNRLGINSGNLHRHEISTNEMVPGCCQGIVGVACRVNDVKVRDILKRASDKNAGIAAAAEQSFLQELHDFTPATFGDVKYMGRPPLAAYLQQRKSGWEFVGLLARPDGKRVVTRTMRHISDTCTEQQAAQIGIEVGEELRQEAGPNFYQDSHAT